MRSSLEEEEMKWVHLIAKDQEIAIDHGVLRLINSFLYSRREKNIVVCNTLKIISAFIFTEMSPEDNVIAFTRARDIPKALVKILTEENGDGDVITICLLLADGLATCCENSDMDIQSVCRTFVRWGIAEALMHIMKIYRSDGDKTRDALIVIHHVLLHFENVQRFIDAGLLETLVDVFNSSVNQDKRFLRLIVNNLLVYDENLFYRFQELGIDEGSDFFWIEVV
jgi:hypothetical protein